MNKVFKVIWSDARSAYVVVSEIAKNHGSKSCSTKKLLTMLIATGVMTCASMAPAMAVNPASDDKNVTIGKGAVSSPYVGQTGNVAIGENAKAWNGKGLQEALMDFGQGGAKVKSFFGVPYEFEIVDGTKFPGSIAIGKNTVARSGSTMIGDHGYTGKIGDTTITPDGNGIMKYNNDVYSTTIGANSFNSGALASVTGVFSIASSKYDGDNYKFHAVQNTGATIYGSMNSIESATSDAKYSGIASSVLGFANKTQNANAALIWGTGNEVTNSVESIDIDYNGWNKLSVAEAQQKAIEAMQSSQYAGGSVMAIGGGNKADYAKYSQLTGVQNKVTGTKKAAKYDFVNGYQNTVTNASDVTVIGIKNEVTADGNKVIGDNHKVSGKDNVIFGSADEVTETTVNNAVILGHNANATVDGGVALGTDSVARRVASKDGATAAFAPTDMDAANKYTWLATRSAVSVGDTANDITRQITDVAAGSEDTDAVNVAQLKKVNEEALKHSTVTKGDNITVTEDTNKDGGKEYNVALKNNIYLAGDNDYTYVNISGSNGSVWASSSVAAGNVIMDGTTATVSGLGNTTTAYNGFANGEGKAATEEQLKEISKVAENANQGWNLSTNGGEASKVAPGETVDFSGDKNITISNDGTNVKVELNEKIDVNSVQTNALNSKYNLSVGTMAENGIMPFFVNSTGDFYAAHNKFHVDKDGKVTATAGEIGNVVLQNGVYYGHSTLQDGSLLLTDDNGNHSYIDAKSAKLGKVTVAEDGKITGVAAGAVTADSTDAVNGSQLHAVATEAGKHSKVVNGNNTNVEETTVDGQKVYKVNLNKNIMVGDVTGKYVSISGTNGTIEATGAIATKDRVYADKGGKLADIDVTGNKISNGASSIVLDGSNVKVNDKVTIDQNGNIAGVNSLQTNALNSKYNLSVGTMAENGIMPFFVNSTGDFYAAHNKFHVDKDGKVTATAGEIGNVVLQNGVYYGHSTLQDGSLLLTDDNGNHSYIDAKSAKLGKVTVAEDGKISGVAAGAITADSTDAVNGSQLHAVATEAGKHSKVVNGNNTNVEETTVDGQKFYKVNMNKDIMLGDLTGKNVSISGTNGTIEATGAIATKDRVYADKGAKLADIDVTGNTISNGDAKMALNGAAGTVGIINGQGASVYMQGSTTVINSKVSVDKDGKISGVAAGAITADSTDAVNGSQLHAVATEAGKHSKVVNGNNTNVEETTVDGQKFYKVNMNKDIMLGDLTGKNVSISGTNGTIEATGAIATKDRVYADKGAKLADIDVTGNTISNGDAKMALNGAAGTVGIINGQGASVYMQGSTTVINSKVSVDKDGKISGVAAGAITADSTDAVNGSQLHAVATEAGKHSKVVNGSNINVEETDVDGQKFYKVNLNKDIMLGDLSGKNVSISGTNGTIETTGYIATKDRVYADKGAKLADIDVTGNIISNGDAKMALDGAAGTAGMINGKGASIYMQDGYTVINSKVAFDQTGKISGVAAGAVTADSTDAVNGSQLHAVATEAGKHSKVVNGSNINVEETDLDGQKVYKVNLNKDIMLGDLTGKNVSISGTNGTIETTGYIATKDRVYADKGAKLADIDVTGDKISNGASSIVLDGSNVKVNDKVTIDQNGKISGVAKGEVSSTSTDAINGSQLKQTNDKVEALDKRVTQNEADIKQNKADIAQNKADIATNKADIATNKADIATNKANIAQNTADIKKVEELAKKHTTVAAGDNITVTEDTNTDGGKEYKVALDKDINLDSVTTGQTVMNNDGLKVGKDVSVTATAVTAGKTSISDEGVKVGDKTYISADGLNANDQKVTNVADADISATSKDAVNGSQLYKTNQEVANNTNRISNLDNRVNKVGAGAAALAALHPLDFDPDAKWDFAAGYGNYRGTNAAAVGAYYRPNEDTMFSVGGTFGNGENMVNAGVSFKLGSGSSHVSTSRVAMAKEIKELRGELEAMKSAMLDANAGKKIDTSKLQLFPDVPQNHWAYEYVTQLAGNGMIEGYPDGNFAGDRPMTRYEFAAILYRAMTKGAVLSDKILNEFSHELEYFTVDTIAKDKAGNPTIQRVRTVKANTNK